MIKIGVVTALYICTFGAITGAFAQSDQKRLVPPDAIFVDNRLAVPEFIYIIPDDVWVPINAKAVIELACGRVQALRTQNSPTTFRLDCNAHYALTGQRGNALVKLVMPD